MSNATKNNIVKNSNDLVAKKRKPAKVLAVDLFAFNPQITAQEVANKLGVSKKSVVTWREDPNFIDAIYDRYMIEFGFQLPSVLNAMVREAQAGNVQAGRLVLEHSGKLVKNVNVTIDSPFEKFLKGVQVAEVIEDEDIIDVAESIEDDFSDLPERKIENQIERTKRENVANKKAIRDEEKRVAYNQKQKEWYKWRKRAEKVGVKQLKGKRPTPAQRQDWQESIEKKEIEMKEQGLLKEKPVLKPFYNDDKNDWATPQWLFDEINEEFNFTLDACADERNHKCDKYFTKEQDSLKQDWKNEIVYMNPPYSGGVLGDWIKKAYEESLKGATVVCLIPSYTSTKYWHEYCEKGEIRFLKGKVKYNDRNPAPFSSCLVIFRPN